MASSENKRQRQGSDECDISSFICQKCDRQIKEKIPCSGCKLHYCLQCAKVSQTLYQCLLQGEMDSFHWTCSCCKATFPSLEKIADTLEDIQNKHDDRMSHLEDRMNKVETNVKAEIQSNIVNMKEGILSDLKLDINKIVDSRTRELEERKRRELNLTIFNLEEHNSETGLDNKRDDEEDFISICSWLGLSEVQIKTSFRLGKKHNIGKPRPLKIILVNKADRKSLLDNARFIEKKVPIKFRRVIVTKDLTPQQRVERRQHVQSKKERKGRNSQQDQFGDFGDATIIQRRIHPPVPMDTEHPALSPVLQAANMSQINELESNSSAFYQFSQPYSDSTVIDNQSNPGGMPLPLHQSTILEQDSQPGVND